MHMRHCSRIAVFSWQRGALASRCVVNSRTNIAGCARNGACRHHFQMDDSCTGARPYTVNQLDSAIAHLEQVLNLDGANSLFSKTYWRARVEQAMSTPGVMPSQHARLQRLIDRIETS